MWRELPDLAGWTPQYLMNFLELRKRVDRNPALGKREDRPHVPIGGGVGNRPRPLFLWLARAGLDDERQSESGTADGRIEAGQQIGAGFTQPPAIADRPCIGGRRIDEKQDRHGTR